MMKRLFILLTMMSLSGLSMAQSGKVGYINTDQVIMMMPSFDSVQQVIEGYAKSLVSAEIQAKQQQLQEKYSSFQKEAQTMSEARREVVATEISQLNNEVQEYMQNNQVQQKVSQREAQLLAPLEKQASETISDVAKANGFSIVLDIRSGIVYADQGTNLLPLVMDELGIEQQPQASSTNPGVAQ